LFQKAFGLPICASEYLRWPESWEVAGSSKRTSLLSYWKMWNFALTYMSFHRFFEARGIGHLFKYKCISSAPLLPRSILRHSATYPSHGPLPLSYLISCRFLIPSQPPNTYKNPHNVHYSHMRSFYFCSRMHCNRQNMLLHHQTLRVMESGLLTKRRDEDTVVTSVISPQTVAKRLYSA